MAKKGVEKMPKEWTGVLVGLMHCNRITNIQLADKLEVTYQYVSMILNGHRNPPDAEERFNQALQEIIRDRKEKSL